MLEKILNFIFPRKCLKCGKQEGQYVCSSCLNALKIKVHIIKENNKLYNYFVYLNNYEKENRKYMLDFKFYEKAYLAEFFCELIEKDEIIKKFLKSYDFLIPVPMTNLKRKLRGYNQVELLVKKLSKDLKIEYCNDVLKKVNENQTQSTLSKYEREQNVKNVFQINNKEKIENKNIILVDDIYTTGATIDECVRLLKCNKVNNICVLVISKR